MPPASSHSPAHHAPPQRPLGAEFSSHIGDLTLFPFCASGGHRRDHQEAAQQHPAEHGDRHRGGDAQSGHAPGQPGVHRREHQQQQLRRDVRAAQPTVVPTLLLCPLVPEPGAGQENLQLGCWPRCLGFPVSLLPCVLSPDSRGLGPSLAIAPTAASYPDAAGQFIPPLCFVPPTSQHLHTAPLPRGGLKREMRF